MAAASVISTVGSNWATRACGEGRAA